MPRRLNAKDVSPQLVKLIFEQRRDGKKQTEIARTFQLNQATISRILKRGATPTPRTGRPPKINSRTKRRIFREIRANPTSFSTELARDHCPHISPLTVRRCLKKMGLANRVARRVPALSRSQTRRRLDFARRYVSKPLSFWENIIWSDESKILSCPTQRTKVWRFKRDTYKARFTTWSRKGPKVGVMVWGSMSSSGVGTIAEVSGNMTASTYVDVLKANLFRAKRFLNMKRGWIFQQDNAAIHSAALTKHWFEKRGLRVLEWPSNSPDLNPIEHLWAHLKRDYKGAIRIKKGQQFACVEKAWNRIEPEVCRRLVASMPRRLRAVIRARGGATRY